MQDLATRLTSLSRPRLLARAARIGADDYSRGRDLKRILGSVLPNRPAAILMRLLDLEAEQDHARRRHDAGYPLPRHVAILIALAAESRLYLGALANGDAAAGAIKNGAAKGAVLLQQ
ncbi:DUF6477 family protein [Phaeobacter sp. HF9A]|uniref:DUF6477 family protein n=1 Tax=Phaeobacter sp. HF9A TaxID=2721561 RepID=UPI0014314E9E|nr:DUF6477 family protein [Phaeobacter sp. HF9A]NIZ15338.1 hypothetical protein [Phaeobacter sp. HF9A]